MAGTAEALDLAAANGKSLNRYDLETGVGENVFSSAYASVHGVAFDSRNDDIYYVTTQSWYNDINRNGVSIYGYHDNSIRMSNLAFDPASRNLVIQYDDVRSPSTYFTRYTSVQTRNVDTSATNIVARRGMWTITGWSGYYDPSPIWAKVHDYADVAVDSFNGKVYWTDRLEGTVLRRNLDGSGDVETIYSGLDNPYSLSLDVGSSKLFLSDDTGILSGSMDGAGALSDIVLFTGDRPSSVDVDPFSRELYWTQDGFVKKANYDGSGAADVTNAAGNAIGAMTIALGHDAGRTAGYAFSADVVIDASASFSGVEVNDTVSFFESGFGEGYEFCVEGTSFSSVMLSDLAGGDFEVLLWDGSEFVLDGQVSAGEGYSFAAGVERFRLLGVGLDMSGELPGSIVTGLSFADATAADVSISVVPEPATVMLLGLGGVVLLRRRR
ncbi:PEP-CTERM sorting domain-containing protein [Anaerohalosphaera lusitana]|nr:PEP-CTERM sorting domain-containing protein [Anaerohalosphaera lusitana]